MPTFKVTLAYDGTEYVGWQRQASGTSIQGLLEAALRDLEGRDVTVAGAGRTDAGVHAFGQVASFTLARSITGETLVRAVNAHLPNDVRLLAADEVAPEFHARFAARRKTYRYRIWNSDISNPFERRYAWFLSGRLDVAAMAAAARMIVGRRDFAAFQAAGSDSTSSEREVFRSTVSGCQSPDDVCDGRLITYEVAGDGFLRHMVRNIAGTLVEIGRGRRPVEWMDRVLAGRDRAEAGPTAPPEGLFLIAVDYDE